MSMVPSQTPLLSGGMNDAERQLEEFQLIGVPIIAVFVTAVVTVVITSVICICLWKEREKRFVRIMHKKTTTKQEPNLEVERGVLCEGFSNMLGDGENNTIDSSADTEIPAPSIPAHTLTASHDDVPQTQGDEGYAVISDMLTRDDEEKGYEVLTSTVDDATSSNEELHGYQWDPNYKEPFFEPATREEELLHQIVELNVESIPERDVEIMDCLGSGQFGTVNRGKWTHRDEEGTEVTTEVAVKTMMDGATEEDKIKFLQEAAIMGQFSHPAVLKALGIVMDAGTLRIVVDLMPNGDLRHFLSTLRDPNSEYSLSETKQMLTSYTRQVTCAVTYLFSKKFVHRDLAARNVLVSDDGTCVKIADFGMSRDLQKEDYYRSHGGKIPVKWTAPEALNYRKYSTASDVWSYGCLVYEIWSLGEKPFGHLTNAETIRAVSNGYRLAPPPGCPRSIYEIMIDCWHPVPELRPKMHNVNTRMQKPDFTFLKWSPKEINMYSKDSRTLGTPLENGQCLHKDLQRKYIVSSDKNSTGNVNTPNKIEHENTILNEGGNKGRQEGGGSEKPEASNNEMSTTDIQNPLYD